MGSALKGHAHAGVLKMLGTDKYKGFETILVEDGVSSPFPQWSPIWAERRVLTWSSAWWTWAAAVATWSSRSASSVSPVPPWMQRAASSSSLSCPSSPYTVPAARYTCRGGMALSSGLQTQDWWGLLRGPRGVSENWTQWWGKRTGNAPMSTYTLHLNGGMRSFCSFTVIPNLPPLTFMQEKATCKFWKYDKIVQKARHQLRTLRICPATVTIILSRRKKQRKKLGMQFFK